MKLRKLHLIPVFLFLLIMLTFIVTYVVAVLIDHVSPGFPYISDTGTLPPESCIFAQFINFAAFSLLVVVYIRFLQVKAVLQRVGDSVKLPRHYNIASLWLGILSCLGLDIVANFQELNVLVVHMIGAFLCFVSSTIYFVIQTHMSHKLLSQTTPKAIFVVRVILSILCIILSLLTIFPGILALREFDGPHEDVIKWRPENGGWTMHLISAISEWILVLCFCIFIASFYGDFKGMELKGLSIKLPPTEKRPSISSVSQNV